VEPTLTWLNAMLAEPRTPARRPNQRAEGRPAHGLTNDLRRAAGHALVALGHALAGDGQRVTTTARR